MLMGNHAPSTGADRTAIGTEAGNYEAGETGNITDGNSPGIDPAGSNEAALNAGYAASTAVDSAARSVPPLLEIIPLLRILLFLEMLVQIMLMSIIR